MNKIGQSNDEFTASLLELYRRHVTGHVDACDVDYAILRRLRGFRVAHRTGGQAGWAAGMLATDSAKPSLGCVTDSCAGFYVDIDTVVVLDCSINKQYVREFARQRILQPR